MEEFYRFVVGDNGIYETVHQDCPKSDKRRDNKPDGSWLARVGESYPGKISFWTQEGLKKYFASGLLKWHASVVRGDVFVVIAENPKNIVYSDKYQIILDAEDIEIKDKIKLEKFLKEQF